MAFRHAIRNLNIEQDLGLLDPDDHRFAQHNHSQPFRLLCQDARDLWQEDPERWRRVCGRFKTEANQLRESWVPKPKGDQTTLPSGTISQQERMQMLFKQLIAEEKGRSGPQSTIPFTESQQDIAMLMMDDADSQDLPKISSWSTEMLSQPAPASSDTMQASSSTIDALYQCESDVNALRFVQTRKDADPDVTAVGQRAAWEIPQRPFENKHPDTNGASGRNAHPDQQSSARKRPASILIAGEQPRRRKSDESHQTYGNGQDGNMHFSFNKGRDSLMTANSSRSLSRSTSANTSFKSIRTDINDSFNTNITAPSFGADGYHNHSDLPGQQILGEKAEAYKQQLLYQSPFENMDKAGSLSYRVIFEIVRVALHNNYIAGDIINYLQAPTGILHNTHDVDDLNVLWSAIQRYVKQHQGSMPTKTSEKVWRTCHLPRTELQHSKLNYTGSIALEDSVNGPLLSFRTNPITIEQSNRLKRKYGSDRILVLGFPSMEANDLPGHLKGNATEFRQAVLDWLTTAEHCIMGRYWRAFYVKSKPRAKGDDKKSSVWRLYFFATHGPGFVTYGRGATDNHTVTSLEKMLEWYFSLRNNEQQPMLKLFSRLQLSVSDTTPTMTFKLGEVTVDQSEPQKPFVGQIIEVDDITYNGVLMTDGCGRLSHKAAEQIWRKLGLVPPMPSAFQARIAGAKGMWIIEPSNKGKESDLWIEISKSQTKFESLSRDVLWADEHRITFEIHEYARPLRSAAMNFQLLPILIDRGVKAQVFMDLLKADLDAKVADLEVAISDPQSLRAWNQEQWAVAESRSLSNGILWEGGMPQSDVEQINVLTEAGFFPQSCSYLRDLCKSVVALYCMRVEERMNIYPGKTVYAYMVPDFSGVLAEDEIHLGFSSSFIDRHSNWCDTMLTNMDVLVARLPAALPSDIHRVRAVFKPELAHLKDVVVFPTRGSFCLADKLSGGDYDGDRAWICWNEAIVKDFVNFPTPKKHSYEHYGIQKDETRVSELLGPKSGSDTPRAAHVTQFIKTGFEFNMRKSMLGRCTNIHEALCYKMVKDANRRGVRRGEFFSPMGKPEVMDLANLLGLLVDTSKNGFTFDEEACNAYLESIKARYLPDPAYKKKSDAAPTNHIIDRLVLEIAVQFRQNALQRVDRMFALSPNIGRSSKDADLTKMFKNEEELARANNIVLSVLRTLKEDIKKVEDIWKRQVSAVKNKQISWSELHCLIREHFLAILPSQESKTSDHPLIQRWWKSTTEEAILLSTQNSWILLKASALYCQFSSGSFPWRACGKELLALKVLAQKQDVPISRDMHQYLKFDRRMWEGVKLKQAEREEFGIVDDVSRFDEDEFMSQAPEDAYESQANAE